MNLLHPTPSSPAECLALDEALLDWSETVKNAEILWFWEPRDIFVVVGYANKVASEVNLSACQSRNVPIFRRCSGGGTIVQMPGGLNYGLVLRIDENGPTRNITAANQFIMEKNRAAIASLFPASADAPAISVRGHTDLCVGEVKFAGNSQRRRKNFLLFHGTLLLNCDLRLISELLPMPSLQPGYRASRSHQDFLTNLNLPADRVKAALAKEWNATEKLESPPLEAIARLACEKYSTPEWTLKF